MEQNNIIRSYIKYVKDNHKDYISKISTFNEIFFLIELKFGVYIKSSSLIIHNVNLYENNFGFNFVGDIRYLMPDGSRKQFKYFEFLFFPCEDHYHVDFLGFYHNDYVHYKLGVITMDELFNSIKKCNDNYFKTVYNFYLRGKKIDKLKENI